MQTERTGSLTKEEKRVRTKIGRGLTVLTTKRKGITGQTSAGSELGKDHSEKSDVQHGHAKYQRTA